MTSRVAIAVHKETPGEIGRRSTEICRTENERVVARKM